MGGVSSNVFPPAACSRRVYGIRVNGGRSLKMNYHLPKLKRPFGSGQFENLPNFVNIR